MTGPEVLQYTANALMLTLLLSMPPIIVASVVGTLFSLFQALTQIQEQTLSFAIKLVAISLTLYLTARWLGLEIFNFGRLMFELIPTLNS